MVYCLDGLLSRNWTSNVDTEIYLAYCFFFALQIYDTVTAGSKESSLCFFNPFKLDSQLF